MEGPADLLQNLFEVLEEYKVQFCIHQRPKSQMVDGEETNYNKEEIADILGIRDEYLRSLLIANGTYLNVPIVGDYFLNIINVIGDGNCGLYSTLVGSYFKRKYEEILTGLTENITQNGNYQRLKGKQVEGNFRKKLALSGSFVPNLSLRKKYANRKRDYVSLETGELQHIADGINIPIKVLSYAELKPLDFKYATFGEIYGQINLQEDILILHTPSGGGHYKLILVRKGRFESGGGAAAATASKLDPNIKHQMMNFLKREMKPNIFRKLKGMIKKKNGNDIIRYHAEKLGFESTQFLRNANMTGQPQPKELTNANRTKMKNFLKSKIPNNNNMKVYLNRSINMLNDEELLRLYLIEKEKDVAKGGSSFVYVSKIGRRKLRYTKTGRKFIINKGKRKYLK
jgi:hypothetical protein